MTIACAHDAVRACRWIAGCSEEQGRTTRTFLSPPMREVHDYLSAWMRRCDMRVQVDAAGNLRGVYEAASPRAPRLLVGSHLDTVPGAGAFDGVLGVVLGISLVEMLGGRRLPYGIEVAGFSDEEGVRFGIPFLGSRAMAGMLSDEILERRDSGGVTVAQAIREFGLRPAEIPGARVDDACGYLEIHIEQGPVLAGHDLPVGVVTGIAGQTRAQAIFAGAARHAGTTPMRGRRDAVAAAAEWIAAVESHALVTPGLVATVGRIAAEPGAANVIAGRCSASLDVRHGSDDVRQSAVARLEQLARDAAGRRDLDLAWRVQHDQRAVPMDGTLGALLERAVHRAGVPLHRLPSGAGHDAMVLAERMPTAMLFLRTPGGISHHPDESVLEDDVAIALAVASHFLDELSRSRTWPTS